MLSSPVFRTVFSTLIRAKLARDFCRGIERKLEVTMALIKNCLEKKNRLVVLDEDDVLRKQALFLEEIVPVLGLL